MMKTVSERITLLLALRMDKERPVAPHLADIIAMANETVEKVRGTSSLEETIEYLHFLYEIHHHLGHAAWVEQVEMPPGSREFLFDFDRPDDQQEVERTYERIKAGVKYFSKD
jgi:hypothetical protein